VRFAPAAAGERVCAVSDDGHLYCLNATNGTLVCGVAVSPD
jgi:outer membrane protein assembly factor BamB